MNEKQRQQTRFTLGYLAAGLLIIWLLQSLVIQPMLLRQTEVPYSQFLDQLQGGEVASVTLTPSRIVYRLHPAANSTEPAPSYSVVPIDDPELVNRLQTAGVEFSNELPPNNFLLGLLGWVIPFIPLVLIWFFLMRRMGQAGANVLSIGKSKAKEIAGEVSGVKFQDVGGAEEVETELKEIIEFLKTPDRFTRMGARLPKGILLVGPPGTGKTLLARATAGEAGVPFFSLSGSDFVEMFVGVGAARVRDLFEQAKSKAPCIVFIDELDAIGQSRSSVARLGSNDEREQTLNQLLNEMDGFTPTQAVVIMAATNRPEILDPALLRPGRFDRQVQVPLPTEYGRRQILQIHTEKMQLDMDVNLDQLAKITPGFSGADLANIVNEAALLAVRNQRNTVTMTDFDLAIERVVAGLQRKMPLRGEVKRKVAYHESGHALVAQLLPNTDPVHKVSIIPTAKGALGYTLQRPEEDQYLVGEEEMKARMAVLMGGRAAELLVFAEASTGAANDLERVTEMARRMVTEFGMSEMLGPVRYVAQGSMGNYLGNPFNLQSDLSPETAMLIDREIRGLVEEAQERALALLRACVDALHEIADILQEREVIGGDEIRRIVAKTGQTLSNGKVQTPEQDGAVAPGLPATPQPMRRGEHNGTQQPEPTTSPR